MHKQLIVWLCLSRELIFARPPSRGLFFPVCSPFPLPFLQPQTAAGGGGRPSCLDFGGRSDPFLGTGRPSRAELPSSRCRSTVPRPQSRTPPGPDIPSGEQTRRWDVKTHHKQFQYRNLGVVLEKGSPLRCLEHQTATTGNQGRAFCECD